MRANLVRGLQTPIMRQRSSRLLSSKAMGKQSAVKNTTLKRRDSDFMLSRKGSVLMEVNSQRDSLAEMLQSRQVAAAAEVIPWFLNNMPDSYFQQVPEELRAQHLCALAGIRDSSMIPELSIRSPNGTLTLIRPTNEPGQLLDMLSSLEKMSIGGRLEGELASMQVYVAKDGSLSLNVFQFAERLTGGFDVIPPQLLQYSKDVRAGKYAHHDGHISPDSPLLEEHNLLAHVKRCRPQYVANTSARRFCLQMGMCDEISKGRNYSEAMATEVENDWADVKGDSMVTLALTNVQPLAAISRVSKYLSSLRIDISRVQLDVIPGEPDVTMLRVLTTAFKDSVTGVTTSWSDLSAEGAGYDLARASKWVDDRVLQVFKANLQQKTSKSHITDIKSTSMSREKSLIFAEATVALSDLTHALLSPADPYQYARSRVLWVMTSPGPARDCAHDIIYDFCSKTRK